MKAERSLKSRALQLLAQRDQSRLELRRKLLRHARQQQAARSVSARDDEADRHADADTSRASVGTTKTEAEAEVEAVLVWLEGLGYLSQERFVEARVHAREGRFGNLRIRRELAEHGLTLSAEAARSLAETELQRARAVRERRFAERPEGLAGRATQSRFLAARGFSPEVVARLMRELAAGPSG